MTQPGGFLFLGNQLALDFLNTRPFIEGEFVELLPDFRALVHWLEAAGQLSDTQAKRLLRDWEETPCGRKAAEAVRESREELRRVVSAWAEGRELPPAFVRRLNALMAEYPMLAKLESHGVTYSTELWCDPQTPEELWAPLAREIAMLFTSADRQRVRKCDHCVLMFLDTSKKGTRRWCSMEMCGNRAKVAAYATRKKEG